MTPEQRRVFEAWSLPRGIPSPRSSQRFDSGGLEVRYPAASPEWVASVVATLRGRRQALLEVPVSRVVAAVGSVGARLLDPADDLRARALDLVPATSGLSDGMAAAVLDGMAGDWTEGRLRELLELEMDGGSCLDRFVQKEHRRVRAMGPDFVFQVVSGSVPGVGATAVVRALLVKAPTLLKLGRGDVVLPVLLTDALRESDPDLADAVAVVYWPGGSSALEEPALAAAEVVAAYGDDESVGEVRRRLPVTSRLVAYHHRVSLGLVGRDALRQEGVDRLAHEVAGAVAFFDQRGCVSPRAVYVQKGGEVSPPAFAEAVGRALAHTEESLPGGRLDAMEASALHQARGTAELMAGAGSGVEIHHGGAANWTVIYDPDPTFVPACIGRVLRVMPVESPEEVSRLVAPFARHLQTVAVAGLGEAGPAVAEGLARVGVTRVAPFDAVPFPPPWWHHDGGGSLTSLLRWVDLEE